MAASKRSGIKSLSIMINFNDLVPMTRPVSGTPVKEDLMLNTEKGNFTLGSHIRKALGDNSLSYHGYILNNRNVIVLASDPDGALYRAKVRQADQTRMSRGATFSNKAFRETIEELYPGTTTFRLREEETINSPGTIWVVESIDETGPSLFTETEDPETVELEDQYSLTN